MGQTTIFDMMYPRYKITKPIRLIEMFAGYGSQALALKYLGVEFEHWKICEWAIKSIQAYKDIHFGNDNTDYSKSLSKEEIINTLYNLGISQNYNEPMVKEQIARINENQLRTILNNIIATNNMVNIQQVKGENLEIVDTDRYDYIMTYSFPCQDLSLAGKKKGMSDTSTRSGMLWEVERILTECKELGNMPQILLMENVPQVHSQDNMPDFHKWQVRLEELGYKSYWQDLIATDYEIPQTRNRCFMVSILGDYSYTFPQPKPLKLKLKDMLEDNVDEKYYLSDKMINYCLGVNQKESKFPRGKRFLQSLQQTNENDVANTITTNAGQRPTDNFVLNKHLRETLEQNDKEIKDGSYIDAYNRTIRDDDLSSTISTRVSAGNDTYVAVKNNEDYIGTYDYAQSDTLRPTMESRTHLDSDVSGALLASGNHNGILIKNATKQGYIEANDGDGIDLAQPNSKTRRGRVQKDAIQTLTTVNNLGVVVNMKRQLCNELVEQGKVKENDVIRHSYTTSRTNDWEKRSVEQNNLSPTLDTRCDCLGVCVKEVIPYGTYYTWKDNQGNINTQCNRAADENRNALTIACANTGNVLTKSGENDLRIRKLTPRECFRLMGVKDEDFDKVRKNQSDASLYHLAGDSIVVNVLMAIFKELL